MIDDLAKGVSATLQDRLKVITRMEGPNGVAHAKDIADWMNAQRVPLKSLTVTAEFDSKRDGISARDVTKRRLNVYIAESR